MPAVSVPERWITRRLTVKLNGRPEAHIKRRGRTLSPGARGGKQTTHHGPSNVVRPHAALGRVSRLPRCK